MSSKHEPQDSFIANQLPSPKRGPPPPPPARRVVRLPSSPSSSEPRSAIPSTYLMNDIPRGTTRPRLMNSLLSPSHIPHAADTHFRPDVFCGITITDSRLDDELSVATIEFSDTPQWLQTVCLDPRGFPKYTEFGTLWRDVNRADTDPAGRTAFITAVINGSRTGSMGLLYAEMLAEFHDTDVNVQDNRGRTALHWASDAGQPDLVRLCLSVPDCVIGLKDHDGLTAFDISLRSGADDTIPSLFYSSMFDLEQRDRQAALLRVLTVTSVPALDMPVFPGEAIFDPIEHTNLPLVQALLDRGIDLTVRNQDGDTALHVAARLGDVHVAGMLLDHGVHVEAEDSRGRTALQVAHEQRVEDMIELLEGMTTDEELGDSASVEKELEVPDGLLEGVATNEELGRQASVEMGLEVPDELLEGVAMNEELGQTASVEKGLEVPDGSLEAAELENMAELDPRRVGSIIDGYPISNELAKSCGMLRTGSPVGEVDSQLTRIISVFSSRYKEIMTHEYPGVGPWTFLIDSITRPIGVVGIGDEINKVKSYSSKPIDRAYTKFSEYEIKRYRKWLTTLIHDADVLWSIRDHFEKSGCPDNAEAVNETGEEEKLERIGFLRYPFQRYSFRGRPYFKVFRVYAERKYHFSSGSQGDLLHVTLDVDFKCRKLSVTQLLLDQLRDEELES